MINLKLYLYAGIGAVLMLLGVTVIVQHYRLQTKNSEIHSLLVENQVSKQSIDDLTDTLKNTTKTLEAKERAEKQKQLEIDAALKQIDKQDKSMEDLEAQLKARKSTSNCPIPKDLNNAWNSL